MKERKTYGFLKGSVKIDIINKYMDTNLLSRREFAKQCNIDIETLSAILTDGANFHMDNLYKVAKAMNVNPIELLN